MAMLQVYASFSSLAWETIAGIDIALPSAALG